MNKLIVAISIILVSGGCAYGQTAENLERAREAYMRYDLEEALDLLRPATSRKGKRTVSQGMTQEGEELKQRVENAMNFMGRVEKLQILDSISVPRQDFFKAYLLPPSAGRLAGADALPEGLEADTEYVFTNEGGDNKIWAEPDSTGVMTLMEAARLTDGSWSAPQPLELPDADDDAEYPFMMADGVTLYYAMNDPDGLGGYDIMVATRDASDGSFLQPQNLGMPYNSPYDDYLLAIDELNGVGWFATDRNRLGDMVTIYVYKLNDLRRNYDSDDEDLADRAMLTDWRSTRDPDEDYEELLRSIKSIDPEAKAKPVLFTLPMDGGAVYTDYSDFKSRNAAALMKRYTKSAQQLADSEKELDSLRRDYHKNPSASLGARIKEMESGMDSRRAELKRQLSEIYRAERK